MSRRHVEIIERVLARAPQWIRQELVSDPSSRTRAEEALAAMIAAALAATDDRDHPDTK